MSSKSTSQDTGDTQRNKVQKTSDTTSEGITDEYVNVIKLSYSGSSNLNRMEDIIRNVANLRPIVYYKADSSLWSSMFEVLLNSERSRRTFNKDTNDICYQIWKAISRYLESEPGKYQVTSIQSNY